MALRFLEALPVGLRKATVDDVRQALGNLTPPAARGCPRQDRCARFSGRWRGECAACRLAMFQVWAERDGRGVRPWRVRARVRPSSLRESPISTPPH